MTPRLGSMQLEGAVRAYGWLFLLGLATMSLFNFEGALPGTRLQFFTLATFLYSLIGLALLVLRVRERRSGAFADAPIGASTLSGRGLPPLVTRTAAGAGLLLFTYAIVTTFFHERVIWAGAARVVRVVPQWYVIAPQINAMLALACGLLVMVVRSRQQRLELMWWTSFIMVPVTVLGAVRVSLTRGEPIRRLWTQFGGAAVLSVALLLCLAIAAAAWAAHYRPRISQWLMVAYLLLLLLTASRAGILILGVFVVLVVVRLARRHTGAGARLRRLPPAVFIAGGAAIALATAVSPLLGRIDQKSGRLTSWRAGIAALEGDALNVLAGMGSGTLWPWYAYESGWQGVPGGQRVHGPFGTTLYHAHSLYVTVLVELGIIGMLLLAAVVWPIAAQWFRGGSSPVVVLTSAVCACLVGFVFDTYLMKNFPVSMLWWAIAFAALLSGADEVRARRTQHAVPAGPPHSSTDVKE